MEEVAICLGSDNSLIQIHKALQVEKFAKTPDILDFFYCLIVRFVIIINLKCASIAHTHVKIEE